MEHKVSNTVQFSAAFKRIQPINCTSVDGNVCSKKKRPFSKVSHWGALYSAIDV